MHSTHVTLGSSPFPGGDEDVDQLEERVANETAASASPDLISILGANLRRMRTKRGLSLERLAKLSGVSRAMLSQVELAYSAPTIGVAWRIANALGVPFGMLLDTGRTSKPQVLRAEQAKHLTSHDGGFSSRALFPYDAPRRTELYEIRLRGECTEHAEPHAPGTIENLVVAQGRVEIGVAGQTFRLESGDSILFQADVAHSYGNPDVAEATLYLVMAYTSEIGGFGG